MKYRKVLVPAINTVELEVAEFTEKIASPTEVIVKTHFSQISAGTELACLAGLEDWFEIPGCPGYTAVGEIVEKGSAVEHLKIGDLVYTFGPHAEYFKIDTSERWHGICVKLPQGARPDLASFTHMADIAITAIRNSKIELGDFVAVTGLGPIGNIAAQLAQLQGATVIGLDISEHRLALAKKCGIKHTVNSSKPNYQDELKNITNGKGVSTLIEASGMAQVAESSMGLIAQYGELILLGSPRAPYQTNLTGFLQQIHLFWPSVTVKGALEFIFPTHQIEFVKHSKERNSAINLELIHTGRLVIEPLFTHTLKPEECAKAYQGLREKKDEFIGVVFDWTK